MIAEQSATLTMVDPVPKGPRTIQMAIRVEIPGDGADVGTDLRFWPELPEWLQESLHRQLYNGVHAGLAAVSLPLPEGGIGVTVLELRIVPLPDDPSAAAEIEGLGEILHTLMASLVASTWTALERVG